jgi:guanylate kinase
VNKPRIFIVSGPSGVGKGALIKELLRKKNSLLLAVSATTRKIRRDEIEGKDYYYISKEQFVENIEADKFVEWCVVHNNKYGTYCSELDRIIDAGKSVLIEIDTQGAKKIKGKIADTVSIFIAPKNIKELEQRLRGRNTEKEEDINLRLEIAKKELKDIKYYDYVIVNDDFEEAIADFEKIIAKY